VYPISLLIIKETWKRGLYKSMQYILKIFSTNNIYLFLAVTAGGYHIFTGLYRVISPMYDRSIHLLFGILFIYLWSLKKSKGILSKSTIIAGMIGGIIICLYIIFNYTNIVSRWGAPSIIDVACGIIAIIIVLDIARRLIGNILPGLALLFLSYAYLGSSLPGIFGHGGYSFNRIVHQMYLTMEGIWGTPIAVSSNYIYLFLILGAFINATGLGNYYIDFANALFGKTRGGPAKIGVIASGLMGSVSGSAVANVAATGAITIPLMKKLGYKSETAAAIEATASTGGQIMPPIMGAAAFVIAEFLGLPYYTIVLAAIIPALIYFTALFFGVHFEALRRDIRGLPADEVPNLIPLIKKSYRLLPIIMLFILLIVFKISPMRAAVYSLSLGMAIAILDPGITFNYRTVLDAFITSADNARTVIASCAIAGIVVGIINLTGLGLKMSSMLVIFGGESLIFVLMMVMIACIIMGMGLPTTPAYIIVAVLGAPALVKLGVLPLASHMFVFYFGIASMISPPVALSVYTACSIADSDFWPTVRDTLKLAFPVFVVPYFFVYNPILLFQGPWHEIILSSIPAFIGAIILASSLAGYFVTRCSYIERAVLFISGLILIYPNLMMTIAGLGAVVIIFIIQEAKKIKERKSLIV